MRLAKRQHWIALAALLALTLALTGADNLQVTEGSGTIIKTDQASGDSAHMQVMKLAYSADGTATLVTADSDGLEVQIGASITLPVDASGTAVPVTDNGGNLSVDDASGTLTVDAPVGTPVFVRLSDGSSAITALPVTDNSTTLSVDDGAGDLSIDDGGNSITVDGTVTSNQGTAAAIGNAWYVILSDGTDQVEISDVSGNGALDVNVVQEVGTTKLQDESGANYSESNPLPVGVVRPESTRVTKQVALTASQTAATLWTPAGSATFVITGGFLSVTGAGAFRAFDNTDAAGNMLLEGTFSAGDQIPLASIVGQPWESAAADNVLKYTSGAGFTGEITVHGYEF
jgi:hypothetical protein